MKQLVCEMCGSNSLVKTGEYFVCESCGTKYTVEAAKKLMIEGTVDVKGTVQVDNTAFVEKYLANARRAMDKTDWGEAEKYYNLVEQNVPDNIEALFFSAYAKLRKELYNVDSNDRPVARDILIKSMTVINDYYEVTKEDKENVLRKITVYIKLLKEEDCVRYHGKFSISTSKMLKDWYNMIAKAFLSELDQIAEKHDEEYIQELISSIDSSIEEGGCYVATCVYGSYDCPQVWTLRRYRDDTLGSTWYGRTFVRVYYATSPTIVKCFGETKWFKKMWKKKLDKMVEKLQMKGVENTPYQDKDW